MKPEPNPLNAEIDPLDYSRWIEREHQRRFGLQRRAWVCKRCAKVQVNTYAACELCSMRLWMRDPTAYHIKSMFAAVPAA